MDFDFSDKSAQLQRSLQAFMDEHVYPAEHEHERQRATSANRFATLPLVEELKDKARAAGLWNTSRRASDRKTHPNGRATKCT